AEAKPARLQQELAAAAGQHAALMRDLGSAQEALARCREQVRLLREKRAERDRVAREQGNYTQLERIFGRNGIQARIIDQAIPEIEREANDLLARLTDNEMRVALHTQRETKTAGVAETLEI